MFVIPRYVEWRILSNPVYFSGCWINDGPLHVSTSNFTHLSNTHSSEINLFAVSTLSLERRDDDYIRHRRRIECAGICYECFFFF